MTKKIDDYSFQEFMKLIKNYVDIARSGKEAELFIFKQENPIIVEEEFEVFLDDFLKAFGVTEDILERLNNETHAKQPKSKLEIIH